MDVYQALRYNSTIRQPSVRGHGDALRAPLGADGPLRPRVLDPQEGDQEAALPGAARGGRLKNGPPTAKRAIASKPGRGGRAREGDLVTASLGPSRLTDRKFVSAQRHLVFYRRWQTFGPLVF